MANDYLRDQNAEQSSYSSSRIVAFFSDKDDAYSAISDLRDAGFTSSQIGLAIHDDDESTSTAMSGRTDSGMSASREDKSMWQEVKDFFTGNDRDDENYRSDFRDSAGGMNWDNDRTQYYQSGIESGGAIVTVSGARIDEARQILEQNDGDLRESGFEQSSFAGRSVSEGRDIDDDRERRIQLRGEFLQTYKERVQRGEVRLRKDVVTENQSIDVPITREELVIERVSGSNAPASGDIGDIGDEREIRVPLSEERVHVDKKPVVNEEVRVGKRQVESTERVSDNVRHEELRVDKEGDIDIDEAANRGTRRKKPAA